MVDYTNEIEALDDWELTHPLPATAYKVMRKLQYLAKKERFPEKISVPNTVLISLVGCSEDSLAKARNQLIQKGLIDYQGARKATPIYTIHYFSHNPVYNPIYNPEISGIKQGIKQGYEQGIEQGYGDPIYINNIYTAKDDDKEDECAAAYFRKNGIYMGQSQCEAIREFYERGMTDEMLRMACDDALEHNAPNFAYIRKIVDNWICAGLQTPEQVRTKNEQYRQGKETPRGAKDGRGETPQSAPRQKFFSDRWTST